VKPDYEANTQKQRHWARAAGTTEQTKRKTGCDGGCFPPVRQLLEKLNSDAKASGILKKN